jgi:hypothetical protein
MTTLFIKQSRLARTIRKTDFLSGFRMALENRTIRQPIKIDHSKTRLVRYSDHYCTSAITIRNLKIRNHLIMPQ